MVNVLNTVESCLGNHLENIRPIKLMLPNILYLCLLWFPLGRTTKNVFPFASDNEILLYNAK